jgi:hypothetical protein
MRTPSWIRVRQGCLRIYARQESLGSEVGSIRREEICPEGWSCRSTEPGVSYAFVPVYTCCVLVFCLKCCHGAAQQGDLWVKIDLHGMDLRMLLDQQKLARQSFIFIKKQKVGVETVYSIPERGQSV